MGQAWTAVHIVPLRLEPFFILFFSKNNESQSNNEKGFKIEKGF